MAQTDLNFEDKPSTKVGRIGEEIVKNFLKRHGIQVLPPPDVAANGASRVDFLVVAPDGDKELVEVKTWRQRVRDGERVFAMEKSKYESYKKYSAEKNLLLSFYIVDTSSEFGADAEVKPCIRWAPLEGLEEHEKDYKEGEEDGVPCLYFPAKRFHVEYFLTEEETQRLVAAIREMDAANAAASEMPLLPEPVEVEKPVETPKPKVIRTGFAEVIFNLKPFENGEPLKFYRTSGGQILCYNAPIFKNVGYKCSYVRDGDDYLSKSINRVCKEVYDVTKRETALNRTWALKVEDVEPVLEVFIEIAKKLYSGQAKTFLKYWQEEVMPTVKGLKTAPKPKEPPAVTVHDKPAATFKRLFDGAVIDAVITEAQLLKRAGLNGTSLITAIRCVAIRDDVDLKALEKFASYVQAESHETAEISARR